MGIYNGECVRMYKISVILSSCQTIAVTSCYLARTVQDEGEIRKLGFSNMYWQKQNTCDA